MVQAVAALRVITGHKKTRMTLTEVQNYYDIFSRFDRVRSEQ